MDHLHAYSSQLRRHILLVLLIDNIVLAGAVILGMHYGLETGLLAGVIALLALLLGVLLSTYSSQYQLKPLRTIQQGILHVAPNSSSDYGAPDLEKLRLGRELVTNIIAHVYQMANVVSDVEQIATAKQADLSKNFIAQNLPLPMVVLDSEGKIVFANQAIVNYLKLSSLTDIVGQNVYTVMDMSFLNAFTFDAWLINARRNKPIANQSWERVKLILTDESHTTKLFDLAAYYNRDNPNGFETVMVLFDHTDQYSQDEQAMSLVALGVHELRTPLTLLRGYIEAFEEELAPSLDKEQMLFMHKMVAASQQLNTFVNNILNIAHVEEGGLLLELHEQDWEPIVRSAASDMALRANVRGIAIEIGFADNIPTVGVDRISIYEVIVNLLDNAIKYSGKSTRIIVKSYITRDGLVETTVQDFGVGVPSEAMPNLFDKFYRNHKNRATVGGTGLGLFLSKAIVGAHGGHIWVQSKEGRGTTFGFTLQPFAQLKDEQKGKDGAIIRSAHGWIKNHSLYRD